MFYDWTYEYKMHVVNAATGLQIWQEKNLQLLVNLKSLTGKCYTHTVTVVY